MDIIIEDECCAGRLGDALREDESIIATGLWTCPECGQEWRGAPYKLDQGDGTRLWQPHCPVTVFKA